MITNGGRLSSPLLGKASIPSNEDLIMPVLIVIPWLDIWEEFKAKRTEYRVKIKVAKSNALKERLGSVDKSNLWESDYQKYKNQGDAILGQIKRSDGSFTQTMKETNEHMLGYFFPDAPLTTTMEVAIDESVNDDPPFTLYEVDNAFNSLENNKAPGFDYLTPLIIKASYKHLKPIMIKWLNLCLRLGVFPRYLKRSRIKLIPKPKANPKEPNGWRPISLLPIIAKVLDKLLTDRLQWNLWKNNKMNKNQFGFRPQYGTLDAIEELTQSVDRKKDRMRKTMLIGLDCTKAFDCARYEDILNALKKKGCPPNIIRLTEDYFETKTCNHRNGIWLCREGTDPGRSPGVQSLGRCCGMCFSMKS